MSDRPANPDDLMRSSSVYREFLAEREEILRHKWIESEKAGHDIGFERALLDWIKKHRDGWRDARRSDRPGHAPSHGCVRSGERSAAG